MSTTDPQRNAVLIDRNLLDVVSAEACASPRLRKHRNFHSSDTALSHRLLNAVEPGSYVAPHRHLDIEKDETMIVLRGQLGIVIFADDGLIVETHRLAPSATCGITIPHGVFHSVLAFESGTVMFESKAGPYRPLSETEKAPWAPGEGEPGWEAFLQSLQSVFRR